MQALTSISVRCMVIVCNSGQSVESNTNASTLEQADQDKVRHKDLGRGLLYPDTFFEERLMFLPPASSVLLVLFSRNHNVRVTFL
jgi:hypothetical protein